MSIMRETMASQPDALRRILDDRAPVAPAAERLAGRRVLIVGIGTSWHAAHQGAALLRMGGVDAWALHGADVAAGDPIPGDRDALVLLSHGGSTRFIVEARERAKGVPAVLVSRQGNPDADLDTVPKERADAYTASHLGALLRLAQLAEHFDEPLGDLGRVPDAVAKELDAGPTGVAPPARLLELAGAGINGWTAAEGALKIREAAYVAAEGLQCEQLLHGPAVALGADDALVCLDGGGPGSERIDELAQVIATHGTTIHRFNRPDLGEPLSIFPLTAVVQKIAVEAAETLGTNPDRFGFDLPGREEAWSKIHL